MFEEMRWEQMHERTGNNLAAAREIMKDAATVLHWSQKLMEEVQQKQEARQQKQEARQENPEAASSDVPSAKRGYFVLVICLKRDLDLRASPLLLRLLKSLATGQSEIGRPQLENRSREQAEAQAEERYLVLERRHAVVVDLRDVKVMDGSGLSCLISGHRALAASGLRLVVLLAPGSQPKRVFEGAGLEKIILALGSLDEM